MTNKLRSKLISYALVIHMSLYWILEVSIRIQTSQKNIIVNAIKKQTKKQCTKKPELPHHHHPLHHLHHLHCRHRRSLLWLPLTAIMLPCGKRVNKWAFTVWHWREGGYNVIATPTASTGFVWTGWQQWLVATPAVVAFLRVKLWPLEVRLVRVCRCCRRYCNWWRFFW